MHQEYGVIIPHNLAVMKHSNLSEGIVCVLLGLVLAGCVGGNRQADTRLPGLSAQPDLYD